MNAAVRSVFGCFHTSGLHAAEGLNISFGATSSLGYTYTFYICPVTQREANNRIYILQLGLSLIMMAGGQQLVTLFLMVGSPSKVAGHKSGPTWSLLLTLQKWVHEPIILGNDQPFLKGP